MVLEDLHLKDRQKLQLVELLSPKVHICPLTLMEIVPHSTDTQSLARDTPYCARSTLDNVLQVR